MTTAVTISERAARRIGEILKTEGDGAMLRISVEGGGCSFGAQRLLNGIKPGGRGGDHPTGTPPAKLRGATPRQSQRE